MSREQAVWLNITWVVIIVVSQNLEDCDEHNTFQILKGHRLKRIKSLSIIFEGRTLLRVKIGQPSENSDM